MWPLLSAKCEGEREGAMTLSAGCAQNPRILEFVIWASSFIRGFGFRHSFGILHSEF